ncbi:MAG: hypothetical protein R3D55_27695 [Chloroflexota bacterium]
MTNDVYHDCKLTGTDNLVALLRQAVTLVGAAVLLFSSTGGSRSSSSPAFPSFR